ncbi:hypothetical protein HK405_011606, partial [Cladochytrium tenue]
MRRAFALLLRAATNLGVVAALIVLVLVIGFYNKGLDITDRGLETYVLSTFNHSGMYPVPETAIADEQLRFCLDNSYINIEANVTSVDPMHDVLKLRIHFMPCGDFGDYPKTLGGSTPLKYPVNITIGPTILSFKKGAVMSPGKAGSLPFYFESGDVTSYPYDVYRTNVEYINGLYIDENNNTVPLPLSLSLIGSVQSWSVDMPIVADVSKSVLGTNYSDGTLLAAQLVVSRSWTVKLFSILVTAVLWILPCLTLFLAGSLVRTARTPEAPVIAMVISQL